MGIRISILEFLRIEHLSQVENFSPLVDFGASVDHLIVLRSCLFLLNILKDFNILSKSGLGIGIGRLCAEILPIFHRKTSEITTFQKNQKNSKFYIFTFLTKNIKLKHFQSKLIEIRLNMKISKEKSENYIKKIHSIRAGQTQRFSNSQEKNYDL